MKKTLLLAAATVVGASIVAIAGISARPSLLATDVKAGATTKTFAFNGSNASIFGNVYEEEKEYGLGWANADAIATGQGNPLQASLLVSDAKNPAFGGGENDPFFEFETENTGFTFLLGVNNLTDLTMDYGVVISEKEGSEAGESEDSDFVIRYNVDLFTEKTEDVFSTEGTAFEYKPGDSKATWIWDGTRTGTGAVRVVQIRFTIPESDRYTTKFYIESINFSWSC